MARVLIALILLMIPVRGFAADPVADLRDRITSGKTKLEFEAGYGYLVSLLKNLNIPVSSQTLVFSKTSLQSEHISPSSPRALYFNDDVYVGWVQNAELVEMMSVDPRFGSVFYIVGRGKDGKPVFERSTGHECSVCHYARESSTFGLSLVLSSVVPDSRGNVEGVFPIPTTDKSTFSERWGGWYVTGTHGEQKHLGNITLR